MKLVFDIGGTRTRMASYSLNGGLENIEIFPTERNWTKQVENIQKYGERIKLNEQLEQIGGGIAGVWDKKREKLIKSPNLPEWEGVEIKKDLENRLQVPTYLENDAVVEGLGEAIMGSGRRKQIVGYLTIGTGIGGVKISDGKVEMNAMGFEPGQQIIDWDGSVGYLEQFAGGAAMKKIYGKNTWEIEDETAWDNEARVVAIGVYNTIIFWSPEIIIMGGGMMEKINLSKVVELVKEQMKIFPKIPEIVKGELGEKAGLYGAVEYLKSHIL